MLAVYRLVVLLIAPAALAWLRWRAPGPHALRRRWRERLGSVDPIEGHVVWIHAASVGEVNACHALVRALAERQRTLKLVVSTFTLTGQARAMELFGEGFDDRLSIVFAPLDSVVAVRRWLGRIRPALVLVIETELWPEMFTQCRRAGIALMLVNARLGDRAIKRYRRFRRLFARTLDGVTRALCQSQADADRFAELGMDADRIRVTGNLKFDMALPSDIGEQARGLRDRWGDRPVWVAGSTRQGEEEIVLRAQRELMSERSGALLVLAPRHPERCDEVRKLIEQFGFGWQSIDEAIEADTAVVLVDRLGRLLGCYAAAPAAFVGGSLVPIGGHNLLEPAAFGKVVVAGRHLHEQAGSADALRRAGALVEVDDAASLSGAVLKTWREPEWALERGRSALGVVEAGRGSVRRSLRLIEEQVALNRAAD